MSTFHFITPPERLFTLIVETTTLCSLHCAGCGRTIDRALGKWIDRHMSASRFQRIVDHSPPAEHICVQGVGEPTLNPELMEIVAIARRSEKYKHIFMSTHGLARNADYYQKLIDAGLSFFNVSVDSFNPKNAERLRAGTDVVKLKKRIRRFAEKRLCFGINITVSKHNITEVPETLEILNKIAETHRFHVGMHDFIYVKDRPGPDYSSWVIDNADIRWIKRALPEWSSRFPNIDIAYDAGYDGSADTPTRVCDAPRTEPWVGVDGMWGVCCYSANTGALGFTSIENLPFDEAWRSEKAQRFLERYASESPRFCDSCPRNCGRFSPENVVPNHG
jgi:MoaA/NifB/PqqE/SkfB family radical SAM enzyme